MSDTTNKLLVAGAVVGAIILLTRKPAGAGPVDLVAQYLARIQAATSTSELNNLRNQFYLDYTSGRITQENESFLYNTYVTRYYQIA